MKNNNAINQNRVHRDNCRIQLKTVKWKLSLFSNYIEYDFYYQQNRFFKSFAFESQDTYDTFAKVYVLYIRIRFNMNT